MKVTELGDTSQILVRQAVEMRVEAKELEDQAGALKDAANTILDPILAEECEEGKLDVPGVGKLSRYDSSRAKFDKDVLKMALVEKGVDTSIVAYAVNKATTKGLPSYSVKFTPEKD